MSKVTTEKVNDMFVPRMIIWDEETVHRSLMALGAEEVLKIRLSSLLEDDVLA
jgi:hypothetical protein